MSELITDAVRANQVAATQRWSQGGSGALAGGAITVLAKFLVGREITGSKRDRAEEAVGLSPGRAAP